MLSGIEEPDYYFRPKSTTRTKPSCFRTSIEIYKNRKSP